MRISDWSSDVCSSDLLGKERVSESICRKSTRAAIHPSANNKGRNINHQGSKSTEFNLVANYRGAIGAMVSGATATPGTTGCRLFSSSLASSRLSLAASRRLLITDGAAIRKIGRAHVRTPVH